jgi:DNA-directed RNA polymerase specialized sigma subunit
MILAGLNLTEQCKRVAVLRFGCWMEQFEIAEELDISQPRVSQHIATVLKRYPTLKRMLTPSGKLQRLR